MTTDHIHRFTALSGIVGFVLYVASALLILDFPGVGATPHQMASYVASHSNQLLLEGFLWGAITAATICFLTGLWGTLRTADRAPDVLATLALGAGLVTYAIVLAGMVFLLVLGYRGKVLAPAEVGLLADLTLLGATVSAFPTVVSVGAFALLILRTRLLPGWIGWLGIVVAAAHLAAAGSFAADGPLSPSGVPVYVAPFLFYIWMVVAAASLLVGRRAAQGSTGNPRLSTATPPRRSPASDR